jgi:DNA-binding MurR/RpiR family transcriptional regulator
MNIIEQIEIHYANMSKSERSAADAVLKESALLAKLPVQQAAKQYHVSVASLVRMAKRIGLSGYSELSFKMKSFLEQQESAAQDSPQSVSPGSSYLGSLVLGFTDALQQMNTPTLDSQTSALKNAMHKANRIISVGIGNSGLSADHLKYLFMGKGVLLTSVTSPILIQRLSDIIVRGDLVIIFSVSGSPDTYHKTIQTARKKNADTCLITMNPSASDLANVTYSIVLPLVRQTVSSHVDPRPLFSVFASCLANYYDVEE